jgi:hypothetical protein
MTISLVEHRRRVAAEAAASRGAAARAEGERVRPGRGKRAAPMQNALTVRRNATEGRRAPDIPLVALARQIVRSRQELRAPVQEACDAGAERRLAARPSEQAAAQASRGAGRWRRRMPPEAAGELRRGSRAPGGEADGARCLAQRPRRAGSPGAGR